MIEAASARKMNYYGLTDAWLYQALDEYSIKGKNVVVYGSQEPWYESICLSYGAKCTTIEYQEITSMPSHQCNMSNPPPYLMQLFLYPHLNMMD